MFKRIALFLTIMFFLSACTNTDKTTTVQFASWGSKSEIEILKPVLQDFEKQNPDIKVDFMHIPQNYFQKIHLLFASKTEPDVIFVNNLYLPVYVNANLLMPLEDIIRDKQVYYDNALKTLSRNGHLYAVPRDVSNLVIYYNKNLFDKYNVPYPRENWTFEEFLDSASKLSKDGNFGISFEEDALFFLPYLMSEGGGILSNDLQLIINSKESQKGLNFYADLRKKYHVAPLKSESASATMAQMFLQQKLAMHLSGRWLVPKYREAAEFNWDIAPFPEGDAGSIVPMDASGWAISANTKNKDAAIKLVQFLSSKECSEKFTQSGLIVPARKDSANSKYFLDGKSPKNTKVFLEVIETSKTTPVSINYNEIIDGLREQLEYKFN